MLNPIHLRTLEAVLRLGSFAAAARHIGYTGSAVSQQMAALERQVRLPLFERDAHGIRPTPTAVFIAERSREMLGELRSLEDDVALLIDGAVGHLRLGSFPTASEVLLPQALSAFRTSRAAVEISLDEGEPGELVPLITSRELDLALVYRYGLAPRRWPRGAGVERLLRENLLLVVPDNHPLAGMNDLDMTALAQETWISTQPGTAAAVVLARLCATAGFEPDVTYRSNNYAVIHGLVAARLGIAVVPALGLRETPGVTTIQLPGDRSYRDVLVLRRPDASAGASAAILQALRTSARELAATRPQLGQATP